MGKRLFLFLTTQWLLLHFCFSQEHITPLDSVFSNNITVLISKCNIYEIYDPSSDGHDDLLDFLYFMYRISNINFTFDQKHPSRTDSCFFYTATDIKHIMLLNKWYIDNRNAINACMTIDDYRDKGKYIDYYPLDIDELLDYNFEGSKVDKIKRCILDYKKKELESTNDYEGQKILQRYETQ